MKYFLSQGVGVRCFQWAVDQQFQCWEASVSELGHCRPPAPHHGLQPPAGQQDQRGPGDHREAPTQLQWNDGHWEMCPSL